MTEPRTTDSRPPMTPKRLAGEMLDSISLQLDGKTTPAAESIALAQAMATLAVADALDKLAAAAIGLRR